MKELPATAGAAKIADHRLQRFNYAVGFFERLANGYLFGPFIFIKQTGYDLEQPRRPRSSRYRE